MRNLLLIAHPPTVASLVGCWRVLCAAGPIVPVLRVVLEPLCLQLVVASVWEAVQGGARRCVGLPLRLSVHLLRVSTQPCNAMPWSSQVHPQPCISMATVMFDTFDCHCDVRETMTNARLHASACRG